MGAGLTLTEEQIIHIITKQLDHTLQTRINQINNSSLTNPYKEYENYLLKAEYDNIKKNIEFFKKGLNPDATPIKK